MNYSMIFFKSKDGYRYEIIMSFATSSPSFNFRRLRMEATGQTTIRRRRLSKSGFLCNNELLSTKCFASICLDMLVKPISQALGATGKA